MSTPTEGPPPTPHDLHCFWHGEEPIPEGAFLVCGECWHCWVTEEEFWLDALTEIGHKKEAGPLYFCPLCSHDF